MRMLLLILAVSAVPLRESQAAPAWTITDKTPHTQRPTKLDFVGLLGFYGDVRFGVGGWYSIPLVPNGFIPALNESFHLEAGAVFEYSYGSYFGGCDYTYAAIIPMGGVRWDFYIVKEWTVFAKAKAGVSFEFADNECSGFKNKHGGAFFQTDLGAGAYWNFAKDMALRLEWGYPWVNVGISMNL
jgi:hypothetical protein